VVCAVTPGNSAVGELVEPRRAAAREHIVQLVLSERLERELGEALLERTTYHVQLTAAGHAFLFEVRQHFSIPLSSASPDAIDPGHVHDSPLPSLRVTERFAVLKTPVATSTTWCGLGRKG
jgi:hypothetical protein